MVNSMNFEIPTIRKLAAAGAVLVLLGTAHAREQERASMAAATPPAQYSQECSACHLAYPPQLLPRDSWQRIMGSLDRHFGTDASLDAGTAEKISAWLMARASNQRGAIPGDRITRSAWFLREHREVPAPATGSARHYSDCAACHPGASKGDFDEDQARIPQ